MGLGASLGLMFLLQISVNSVSDADWCYGKPLCGPGTWSKLGSCGGTRQSPVDLAGRCCCSCPSDLMLSPPEDQIHFMGYADPGKLIEAKNIGHTVEIELGGGVSVSGAGLGAMYSGVSITFHWGDRAGGPGSEHRVDTKQYPMEMHILHKMQNLTMDEAKKDPQGIAILGFFIDTSTALQKDQQPDVRGFKALAARMPEIAIVGSTMLLDRSLTIYSLIGEKTSSAYFRYLGSLTTPDCEEAVVWTVFKDPIAVPDSVITAFTSNAKGEDSELIQNNFRPVQPLGARTITSGCGSRLPDAGIFPLVVVAMVSSCLQTGL